MIVEVEKVLLDLLQFDDLLLNYFVMTGVRAVSMYIIEAEKELTEDR